MKRSVEIIEIPTSAGSTRPGIELAPAAVREADLCRALRGMGINVVDRRDGPPTYSWRATASGSRSSNVDMAYRYAEQTHGLVGRALRDGHVPLVIGGDCSIEIGAATAQAAAGGRCGLIYVDGHADLNTPGAVPEGRGEFVESFDWMVNAHLLGLAGTHRALDGARSPILVPPQIAIVGHVPEQASAFELERIVELGLDVTLWSDAAHHPEAVANRLLGEWSGEFERLFIHLDVDVLNFRATPIAETTASVDVGLDLDQMTRLLRPLVRDPRFVGLTVSEIYPRPSDERPHFAPALKAFVAALASTFAD